MWISSEEMRLLHQVRGEERHDWPRSFLRAQSMFDWLTGDVRLKKADLLIVGGDPVYWGSVLLGAARSARPLRIAIDMGAEFSGAPLGAICDETFRASVESQGLGLPWPEEIKGWFKGVAGEFGESRASLILMADPISITQSKKGLLGILGRENSGRRKPLNWRRQEGELDLVSPSACPEVARFHAQSKGISTRARAAFLASMEGGAAHFSAKKTYGDVLRFSRCVIASQASRFVRVDSRVDLAKIKPSHFSICGSGSISEAVDAWKADLLAARGGRLFEE